jgi:(E)-2-((N-methylformamido)methylene)succinate hydrolase
MSDHRSAALLMPRLHAGDTAYLDEGQGEVIVFIHGVGLNADAWKPQIEIFSKTHRVIALDILGHGETAVPQTEVTLQSYVEQVRELLDALNVAAANVIGHSMGGLIAIGFAFAHSKRTLRLGVLNSVYKRSPEKRAAAQARAREIIQSGTSGDIEAPLERWFGPIPHQPATAQNVHKWLQAANPQGYGMAYDIFAGGDETFVGILGQLNMPALFATGAEDANSTSMMAEAMAAETPQGKALTIEGARHMMNLTHVAEVNSAVQNLLEQKSVIIDPKDLRKAFGTFMTGVTVVTTRDATGNPRGFTANSFSSVSLDPPLLLVCIAKSAASYDVFSTTQHFAVNILAETQKTTSGIFASKRDDKFSEVDFTDGAHGSPLLNGAVAWFECSNHNLIDAGDHAILIGRVIDYDHNDASPLGYTRGGYFSLDLEQSAVNAAAQDGRAEVGAILECDSKLLVFATPQDTFELPTVGRGETAGSTTRLLETLGSRGVTAKLGFLFAVYENRENHTQSIYYRGTAESPGEGMLLDFETLDFEKFRDDATRAMVRRYCTERVQGRYKIYSGDHLSGDVRALTT